MLPSAEMKPITTRKLRAGLFDADAGLLDFLRQQRHGGLQLVLHLHLRDVGTVPCANVSVIVAEPSALASEVMYVRLSMPFSCCSMTWITVSCTVCAEAPG